MTLNKNFFMRSDRNDEIHAEIKSSFLTRLIDDGPALVAAVLVTAASTVIGWGIYSDLSSAFYASAHDRFLVMLAVVCTLFATAGFGFGRSAGIRRGRKTPQAGFGDEAEQARRQRQLGNLEISAGEQGGSAGPGETFGRKTKDQRLRFLSEAAQELRAPLTSMCLAARIIRKHHESTPEVVERFGETLVLEADKLGETIDEFLDLTRMEYGCVDWQDRDLEPAELLNAAISEIEPLAVGYGVGVSFVLEPELTPVLADYERIRQVLTVLLGITVREAADDVEVCIQIAGASGGWVISVGDSRRVYSHSDARRIVTWSDSETDEEDCAADPAAHGIGLNVCREIVARYEGRLWVEGDLSESGCVRVTIPYPTEQELARAATIAARTRKKASSSQEDAEAPDLVSRHEAAVRALSERASQLEPEDEDHRFPTASDTDDEAQEREQPFTADADSVAEQTPASRPPAVQGGRSLAADSPAPEKRPEETPALDGSESPKAIPNRPDLRSTDIPAPQGNTTPAGTVAARAADHAPVIEGSAPDFTNVEAIHAKTSERIETPQSEPSKPLATLEQPAPPSTAKATTSSDASRIEKSDSVSPNERESLPKPADAAPATAPAERPAARRSRVGEKPAAARRPALPRSDRAAADESSTAPRPVRGMAISARRRPGARPMLALSGPSDPSSAPDSSVRGASDKDLLELAFGNDGNNDEISKREAELVAKATGTTVAPYNPKSRTARSVRSAASPRSKATDGNRSEPSRTGERPAGRLDSNVAKRLGIK